jgi:hypothetical protein
MTTNKGKSKDEDEDINNYEYYKYIKTPKEMGISSGSTLAHVSNGVAGIMNYIKLLVDGNSVASTTGQPLGNRFFLPTSEKCKNKITGRIEDRSLYFDNIPSGNLGLIKDIGSDITGFRGLLPGAVEDVMAIGKIDFFSVFTNTGVPDCLPVKLVTIDKNNKVSRDTGYITVSDIKEISPCNFISRVNPVTENACTRQGFTLKGTLQNEEDNAEFYRDYYKLNVDDDDDNDDSHGKSNGGKNKGTKMMMPDDLFLQLLFYSLGALTVYVALKMMANMYKKRD